MTEKTGNIQSAKSTKQKISIAIAILIIGVSGLKIATSYIVYSNLDKNFLALANSNEKLTLTGMTKTFGIFNSTADSNWKVGGLDWIQSFVHKDTLKCDLTIRMEMAI
jgi:hypothetical protein